MPSTVFIGFAVPFLPEKAQVFISFIYNKNFYNGKTMPKLVLSTRAIQVINTSINLFHHHGFHTVGVDRIVKESKITKATFYNFFIQKSGLLKSV